MASPRHAIDGEADAGGQMLSSPTRPPSQSPLAATAFIVTSPAAAGGHSGAERALQCTTPDAPRELQWGANLQAAVRQQVAIALLRLHSLQPAEFVRYVDTLVRRCSLQMLVDTLHALTGCCAEPGLSALALSLGARTLPHSYRWRCVLLCCSALATLICIRNAACCSSAGTDQLCSLRAHFLTDLFRHRVKRFG